MARYVFFFFFFLFVCLFGGFFCCCWFFFFFFFFFVRRRILDFVKLEEGLARSQSLDVPPEKEIHVFEKKITTDGFSSFLFFLSLFSSFFPLFFFLSVRVTVSKTTFLLSSFLFFFFFFLSFFFFCRFLNIFSLLLAFPFPVLLSLLNHSSPQEQSPSFLHFDRRFPPRHHAKRAGKRDTSHTVSDYVVSLPSDSAASVLRQVVGPGGEAGRKGEGVQASRVPSWDVALTPARVLRQSLEYSRLSPALSLA